MRFLLIALIAVAFVFLYGCLSVSPPQNCAALPPADQPACTYRSAVTEQNPYVCYSIAEAKDRETCLKDAIDPSAAKKLARMAKPSTGTTSTVTGKAKQPPSPSPSPNNGTQEAPAPPENATNLSS